MNLTNQINSLKVQKFNTALCHWSVFQQKKKKTLTKHGPQFLRDICIIFGNKKKVSLATICMSQLWVRLNAVFVSSESNFLLWHTVQHNVLLHFFYSPCDKQQGVWLNTVSHSADSLILRKSPWKLNYLHFSSILACKSGPRWVGFVKKMTKNLVRLRLLKCVK